MKKQVSVSILLVIVLCLGIIFSSGALASSYKEEVIIAPHAGFTTQDVQNCAATVPMAVYYSVFNTLVRLDVDTGQLKPDLAISWKAVSDTVWEVKLRDDVYFHDGTHFTAEDVKFTIERGVNQSKSGAFYQGVKNVKVVDDYTAQIELDSPNYDFMIKITDTRCSMLSKKAFETLTPQEANTIGTGAFKYDKWVEGDYVTLVRNDDYWGELPKTKRLTIKTMNEATTRLVALQTGEVDLIAEPTATDLHFFDEDENIKLLEYTGSQNRFIGLNISVKPLDNLKVRQAIAYGVNRDDFIVAVYENLAKAQYNFQHPSTPYYISGNWGIEYNPKKAKELLAEAGYPNGFSLDIVAPQDDRSIAVNTIFQAQMADIGIKLNAQNLEVATFITATESANYTMCVDYTATYFAGLDRLYRNFFYAQPGKINRFGINHARMNELMDKGISEFDEKKREAIYTELQKIIFDELYCMIPLVIEPRLFGAVKGLEGLPTPGTYPNYTYVHVVLD